jgi:hypothetical protein
MCDFGLRRVVIHIGANRARIHNAPVRVGTAYRARHNGLRPAFTSALLLFIALPDIIAVPDTEDKIDPG